MLNLLISRHKETQKNQLGPIIGKMVKSLIFGIFFQKATYLTGGQPIFVISFEKPDKICGIID